MPKILTEAELVAFYSRPFLGPGGAFKPLKYLTKEEQLPRRKNRRNSAAAVLDPSPNLPASSLPSVTEAPAINVAATIAENQRMYREADSPVASAKAAWATPATAPRPPRPPVVRSGAHADVPEFLRNTDLHGLEPALSVRTRILLASHAMNRMNMQVDIAKSFAIAGYFPRVRFALSLLLTLLLLLLLLCSSCILADQRNLGSIWLTWLLRKESYCQETFVFRAVDAMNKCVCARTVFVPDLFFSVL